MVAAASLVCQSCGNLRAVCSDPDVDWHPQESVCWATATRQWGVRRLQAKHAKFKYDERDGDGELVMSPLEGRSVWVSDIDLEALGNQQGKDGNQDHEGDLP